MLLRCCGRCFLVLEYPQWRHDMKRMTGISTMPAECQGVSIGDTGDEFRALKPI